MRGAARVAPRDVSWDGRAVTAKNVLVIEDDAAIRRGLVDALAFAGFRTFEAGRGPEGLRAALELACDLVLLDLVLPDRDGFDILREIRSARATLPVIILTARGAEADRVRGLDLGADDYVVKPFSPRELLARVKAVLRRSPERPDRIAEIAIPGGRVDFRRAEVAFTDGRRKELSPREVELLGYLAAHAGRTVSREELLRRVWGLEPGGLDTRTIDMHVVRLRGKLRDAGPAGQIIVTVRGRGYRFAPPEEG